MVKAEHLRVFATWRKDFQHINKTRDNRAIELGARYATTLVCRTDRTIGDHVLNSDADVVLIEPGRLGVVGFYLKAIRLFVQRHREAPFDVVYSFLAEEPIGWTLRTLARGSSPAWVVDLWDSPELIVTRRFSPKWFAVAAYLKLMRSICPRAEVTIAGILPEGLEGYLGKRVVKATNGVWVRNFEPKEIGGSSEAPVRFVYVGHFAKTHGIPEMIDAAEVLAKGDVPFSLVMIGFDDPSDPGWVDRSIRAKGLEDHVEVIGELPAEQVAAQLRKCDVGLYPFPDSPGLSEIYPIKVYEYLATGLPVVASDLPGVRTIIDESNGMLFQPSSIDSLAGAMRRYIEDEAVLAEHSRNSRESVSKFDWELVFERMFGEMESYVQDTQR